MFISKDSRELDPRISLNHINGQTIGLYPEYPILGDLVGLVNELPKNEGVKQLGWRRKISVDFMTPQGVLPLIVKTKTPFEEKRFDSYKKENLKFRAARLKLREGGLSDFYREGLEYEVAYHHAALPSKTVAREVTMARAAAIEYHHAYGEPLSIEKPVGFAIDKEGRKWSFYERVQDTVDMSKLPESKASSIRDAGVEFIKLMDKRLLAIGIDTPDLTRQWLNNILICGDHESPRYVLIDTEDWLRVNRL